MIKVDCLVCHYLDHLGMDGCDIILDYKYKSNNMITGQQSQHSHTAQKLRQLPPDLLSALLLSTIKSHQTPSQLQSSLSSQIPQQLLQIDVHQHQLIIMWLYVRLKDLNQDQRIVYGKLAQYLQSHSDNQQIIQILVKFVYDYHCKTGGWIKYKRVNSFFKGQALDTLIKLELTQLKNQPLTQQVQFINYLQHELLGYLVSRYTKEASSTLFDILKTLLEIAHSAQPSTIRTVANTFMSQYIAETRHKWSHKQSVALNRKYILVQPSMLGNIFLHLKFIQLLHIACPQFAFCQLLTEQSFLWSQLYPSLCSFDIKGANALAINIYGAIMKQIGEFDQDLQVFIDVYLTLDSYGMHLIRDVWSRFYTLCRNAHKSTNHNQINHNNHTYYKITTTQYLHILLKKVEQHSNSNVPKHCIQSLLSQSIESTAPIFEYLEETVYGSLVQILNTGTHYTDITHFHEDSKIYGLVRNFYLTYYQYVYQEQQKAESERESKLKRHVSRLIESMHKYITFQHCIVAYISLLDSLPILPRKYLDLANAETLVELGNKFYIRLTFRKRHKLTKCILTCIRNYLELKNTVNLAAFMEAIVMKLPTQMAVFRNRNATGKGQVILASIITENYDQQEIKSRIQQIQQIIKQQRISLLHVKNFQQLQHNSQQKQLQYRIKQLNILSILLTQQYSHLLQNNVTKFMQISAYTNPIDTYAAIYTLYLIANYSPNDISEIGGEVVKYGAIDSILQVIGNASALTEMKNGDQLIRTCLEVVASGITSSNNSAPCKSYAKFMQYNISMIKGTAESQCSHYHLNLLIDSLKFKLQYTVAYASIEDCLYHLFEAITQHNNNTNNNDNIGNNTGSHEYSSIPASSLLRLQLLLFTILCNDPSYSLSHLHRSQYRYLLQIREYCNLYDYEHYEELFMWMTAVCKLVSKAHHKNKLEQPMWEQYSASVCADVRECIKSMLHNLDYGIHVKEVESCTQAVVQVCVALQYSTQAIELISYVIDSVGQQYWGFQRCIVFELLQQVQKHAQEIPNTPGVIRLIRKFICLEQYRGEDSAILLPQFYAQPVYTESRLHGESDYDGTALRFATIDWCYRRMSALINFYSQNNKDINFEGKYRKSVKFWMELFEECKGACIADCGKDRMFLTGGHKTKIKHCQLLMCFPQLLHVFCTQQEMSAIMLTFLNALCQPNLVEIKHYLEVFFLRLLFRNPIPSLLPKISAILMRQLLEIEGQSGLLKNVSFMMISGLVLELKLHLQMQQKQNKLEKEQSGTQPELMQSKNKKFNDSSTKWWRELFAVLLSSVCSHIAYFRGISQYFCYSIVQKERSMHRANTNKKDKKYIDILYKEYLKDEDAMKLTQKLQKIVHKYKNTITKWSIYEHLLCIKPTVNGEVVSQDNYIDKLKYLSYELIKQHRHEDGYMPYKQAWKKIQVQPRKGQSMTNSQQLVQKMQTDTKPNSFQRKIDPSLDDLYNFETNIKVNKSKSQSNFKVLVVSAEQIAFYGHMARVGEILGIKQLIIPTLSIVQMEDFYNVSVTAEKWLKITQHKFEYTKQNNPKKQAPQKSKKPSSNKPSGKQTNKQQKTMTSPQTEQSNIEQIGRVLSILQSHIHQGYALYLIDKTSKSCVSIRDINTLQQSMPSKCLLVVDELGVMREKLQRMCVGVCFNQYYSEHVQATIFMWTYFKQHTSEDAQ